MSFPEMSLVLLISARQCKVPVVQMKNGPTCSPDLSPFANILCAMKQKMQQKRLRNEILSVREWESIKLPPQKVHISFVVFQIFFFGNQVLISVFHSALLNKSKGGGQRSFFFPPWSCLPQLASSWPAGQSVTPSHHWDSHLRFPSPHLIPWIQDEETGIQDRNQKKNQSSNLTNVDSVH